MDTLQRRAEIALRFDQIYHQPPQIWARAPGRVDLMGSHTDYNLGHVMTMTIDRDVWIAAVPREDGMVCMYSMNEEGGGEFPLDAIEHDPLCPWTDYIRGMALILKNKGCRLDGFNGLVHSTIPTGSGLSSSAALEMAAGVIFQHAGGFRLDPVELALLGQKAENHFVGVNCGILDQYSSAMGRARSAVLLDCRDLTSQAIPMAAGIRVVICDTRSKRTLAGTEYGDRRAQCEQGVRILRQFDPRIQALRDVSMEQFERYGGALPELVAKRCRFILEENQRCLDLAGALSSGDRGRLRELYAASYAGARDLYEIGCLAMERMMVAMSSAPGVIGARQAGAGFGGCMVALVDADCVREFQAQVTEHYQRCSGIEPAVYPVFPSDGAGVLAS